MTKHPVQNMTDDSDPTAANTSDELPTYPKYENQRELVCTLPNCRGIGQTVDNNDQQSKIGGGLKWLNERAWPLGGSVLIISVLYLYNYIIVEQVPISILSSSFATALPALFAMLLFVVTILAGAVLMPIQALLTPMTAGGIPLVDLTVWGRGGVKNKKSHRRVTLRWLLGLGLSATIIWSSAWALSSWVERGTSWWVAAQFAAFALAGVVFWLAVTGVPSPSLKWGMASSEFRWALCLAAFVQQLIMVNEILLVSHAAEDNNNHPFVVFFCYMAAAVFGTGLFQLLGAYLILVLRKHSNPVSLATILALSVLALIGMFPPVSARLASYPLQVTASGGRTCTRFSWVPGQGASNAAIPGQTDARLSPELHVLAQADQTYIVRRWKSSSMDVYLVPASSVSAISGCASVASKFGQH